MFQTYEQAVSWIMGLMPEKGIKPGLARMEAIMEHFGHPERRLKFIHVAGTNGKGSTCAFLASVIRKAGYDVGLFNSPFMGKYTGRIQYNGEGIPEEALLQLANQVKEAAAGMEDTHGSLSMFEVTTVIAILYFATVSYPDYVVWETGLGGRLDSTNIVIPIISVVTQIGLDHTDVLGDTIEQIAKEKAGIFKAGVPVVTGVVEPTAARIIREQAAAKKCSLYELGQHFKYETKEMQENSQVLDFTGPFRGLPGVRISLNGKHQQANAAVALMTLEVLRQYYALVVDDEDLYAAMESAVWEGRLEMVSRSPRILLDGAHNPDGAKALVETLQSGIFPYRNLIFILGMVQNKNHREYLRHILPIVKRLIITEPDFFKKTAATHLLTEAETLNRANGETVSMSAAPDWKEAVDLAKKEAGPDDLIIVTGSLYIVSDVRSLILNKTDSEKGW